MKTQVQLPSDYVTYCRRIYKLALGCAVGEKAVMCFGFSKRELESIRKKGKKLLFATENWEVVVDFSSGTVDIDAINTDVGDQLLPV